MSEGRPLAGRTILVARAPDHASALGGRLRALGATVIEAAATRIEPFDRTPLRAAVKRLHDFGWLVFTSRNAVAIFRQALGDEGLDARALSGIRVAAVGPATAEALAEAGITADLTPARFVAEGILEALRSRDDIRGARVLYATAAGARSVIPDGLASLGAEVERIHVYRTVSDPEGAAALREAVSAGVDLVVFAAGSAVDAFVEALGVEVARTVPVASIGPVTSDCARQHGMTVAVEASVSTGGGLATAIERYFG